MLESRVGRQNGVVGLNYGAGELWSRVYTELELGLLSVVSRESLKEQGTKAGSSSSTERVEDKESLQSRAVVRQPSQLVHDRINELLANSVMSTGI